MEMIMRSAEKLFVYAVLLGGIGLVTALVVFMAGGLKDEAVSEAAVEKHVKGIDALNGEVRGEIAGETVEKPLKEAVEPGTEGVAQNPSRGAGTASATLVDALIRCPVQRSSCGTISFRLCCQLSTTGTMKPCCTGARITQRVKAGMTAGSASKR